MWAMGVVIYNSSPGSPAFVTLDFLRGHGLSPEPVDDPFPDGGLLYASGQTYYVRIAVPADEVSRAIELLAERDAGRAGLVERASAQFHWQLGLGFVVSVLMTACVLAFSGVLGAMGLDKIVPMSIASILVGTVVFMVIIGRVAARWNRRQEIDAPMCRSCGYVLLGLTEPRCPECGYPFSPELLDGEEEGADWEDESEA